MPLLLKEWYTSDIARDYKLSYKFLLAAVGITLNLVFIFSFGPMGYGGNLAFNPTHASIRNISRNTVDMVTSTDQCRCRLDRWDPRDLQLGQRPIPTSLPNVTMAKPATATEVFWSAY
ncbi:predicted protein [Histoplasma capsulatum G186AR]|uniref:Uncharacterized protein n=1 Tax=Ajellomyces capsulatus (strain G186AR / H82 / ATCC MYA-2454 / RMSCC 2432) TaxID=447093 RepID=C0P0N4_AJECG|nr:uncharacterized protein HCBG_08964 [Histoplasma capsulatum G186AR]EEH02854.1 predicted protein [Histoplasma capsulatum G186AR]